MRANSSINLIVLLGLLLLAAGALRWQGKNLIEDFHAREEMLMRVAVTGAAQSLNREIHRLQGMTLLLARQQAATLNALAAQPGDAKLNALLGRKIAEVFDDVYVHSLADDEGDVILPDPLRRIGRNCRFDLNNYAQEYALNQTAVYTPSMHFGRSGSQFSRHFDIIVKNNPRGFLLIGIHADVLQEILRHHELPGQKLLLLSGERVLRENLSVDSLPTPHREMRALSPDEYQQLRDIKPIRNTVWKLAARPRAAFLAQRERAIWTEMTLYGLALSAVLVAGYLMLMRETRRRARLDLLNATLRTEVGERKRAENRLLALTRYDPLTGLANRASAEDFMRQMLAAARRNGQQAALLFFDIDRFKDINDSLGHGYGDLVLKQAAQRLAKHVREEDLLARWGGDEFMVVMPHIESASNAAVLALKLVEAMREDIVLNAHEVRASISIGIAIYPDSGEDVETLIKNADQALYRAKLAGRDRYQFFTVEMDDAVQFRVRQENELRHAITRREFEVYYQPRMEIATGKLAAEALLRWNHPERGLLFAGAFLNALEDTAMILTVEEWVLDQVCRQMRAWQTAGLPIMRISVNISGKVFSQHDLVRRLSEKVAQHGLRSEYLEFEITETFLMENTADSLSKLHGLANLGFKLSLDDFGTGYSSLAYLRRFPIHSLKVDQSFVEHMHVNDEDREIVRTIIGLAHTLNLTTVLEGIENVAQYELARTMGCDEVQGFLIAPPLSATQMEMRLAREIRIKRGNA